MELVNIPKALPAFNLPVVNYTDIKVIKIPDVMYQILYEIAGSSGSTEYRQTRLYSKLLEYLTENYPGWGLQQMLDLNNTSAAEINEAKGTHLSWGMYCLLVYGTEHMKRTTEVNHQIEDNGQRKLNNNRGS